MQTVQTCKQFKLVNRTFGHIYSLTIHKDKAQKWGCLKIKNWKLENIFGVLPEIAGKKNPIES